MDEVRSRQIKLQPSGWQCVAGLGDSLLEAALLSGVRLPNSCRNGTCRTCMCKLLQGSVSYRIEWPGLSADEKSEGWILPCVALAESDVTLDVPDAVKVF